MDPRDAFAAELAKPEDAIRLERVALLVAAEEYPGLDVDEYLGRLDGLAAAARARLSGDEGPSGVVAAINGVLYRDRGFAGNRAEYYDPRNSYLNEVIDRRTGIPITLSVVYAAVAWRLGHRLVGVNLPYHFMLGWRLRDGLMLIDAFDGGTIVTERDCAERLSQVTGHPVELGPEHFETVGPRPIVRRMLNNLFGLYAQRDDHARALAALERMHLALPVAQDLRDRGLLLEGLGRHDEAAQSLLRYLEAAPFAADREAVVRRIEQLRRNV